MILLVLAFVALAVGAVIFGAGAALVVRGWRGKLIDELPRCAACTYVLSGHDVRPDRCPECGSTLRGADRVTLGQRRMSRPRIALGVAMMVGVMVATVMVLMPPKPIVVTLPAVARGNPPMQWVFPDEPEAEVELLPYERVVDIVDEAASKPSWHPSRIFAKGQAQHRWLGEFELGDGDAGPSGASSGLAGSAGTSETNLSTEFTTADLQPDLTEEIQAQRPKTFRENYRAPNPRRAGPGGRRGQ